MNNVKKPLLVENDDKGKWFASKRVSVEYFWYYLPYQNVVKRILEEAACRTFPQIVPTLQVCDDPLVLPCQPYLHMEVPLKYHFSLSNLEEQHRKEVKEKWNLISILRWIRIKLNQIKCHSV